MSDGGAFRAAPTGERIVGKRGRPLAGKIAGIVAALATGLTGLFARDNDKSSEDVKVK